MPLPDDRDRHGPARLTLVDIAYRELLDLIVTGELAPGEILREDDLAAWLGVSRTPLRDALARLEDIGVVVSEPRRGTWVSELDAEMLRHAAVAMGAVMGTAARLAWPRMSEHEIARLRASIRTIGDGPQLVGNQARRAALRVLVDPFLRACGNPVLVRLEQYLRPYLKRIAYLAEPARLRPDAVRAVCEMLEEAFEAGRPTDVGRAVERAYVEIVSWTVDVIAEQERTQANRKDRPAVPRPAIARTAPRGTTQRVHPGLERRRPGLDPRSAVRGGGAPGQ